MAAALLLVVRRSVVVRSSSNSCCSSRYLFSKFPYYYYYYYYYYDCLHFSTKTPPSAAITTSPQIVFTEDYFVSKYHFSPGIASKIASVSARMKTPQNPDLSTKTHHRQSPTTTTPQIVFTEDFFVSKYQFSPQIASKLASVSARMRNPQNADLVLSFLKQTGFSNAHLDRIVRHHTKLLSTCPEKSVKPKFKIFQDLGLSDAAVTTLIGRNITILLCKADRIIHSLDVYRRLLGSNDHVVEFIKKHNSMLYADPEKTILPNIQFLKTCGVQMDQINTLICTLPHLFTISPENMRRCVHKVDEMGVQRSSKMFIYAACAVCTMSDETLKLKLKSFQDLGFSEDDISRMFRSAPGVIAVSTRKIMEVKEVLLETGKYDMSCIIKNPASLMSSVEKRYKPRLQVLKTLERKGIIDKWPTFSTLFAIPNKMFFKRFVAPNMDEVGEDFIAKTSISGKLETSIASKRKLR